MSDRPAAIDRADHREPIPAPAPAPAPAAVVSRNGRLLGVVRKLIDYGKDLAHRLKQRSPSFDIDTVTRHFGTLDVVAIVARITRGLRLAAALETQLVNRPLPEVPAPLRLASERKSHPGRKPAPLADRETRLGNCPTAEAIAAELRHRPVGAVLADICRDLGIVPAHPLWHEIDMAILEFGGDGARFFIDILDRVLGPLPARAQKPTGSARAAPLTVAACGTGPPLSYAAA